ncbi:hypothetical protein H716_03158 [Brucella ovis IntaBari-2001-319-5096]|nr:hypothetical protein C961_03132 [Brucella ovis F8/05B]ENS93913.1 hypothetical protein B999_02234 [Brucella ovis 63/96]ENS95509.1 hypothetical protein C009_03288 [Brucella ovis 81/8]ENT82296.1 hypothetical protein H713_02239 [Brucella ovis IntaBari-2010-47-268]ENT92345.1 hypothetical protein H716_03158 [Brucella ovis IntaBari-2001-319-5096]ENT99712.1 hypothetical protein H718_03249 [Brucella ovis IntaBari-2008-114-542]ENU05101.1 hypothetical protein H719_02251 [Brucella ovis IntaBari-1993-7
MQCCGNAVFDGEIAVENLDDFSNDHREAERDQQFMRMAESVDTAQNEAFDQNADDHGRNQDCKPEAGKRLKRVSEIGSHHIEGSMCEVENPHHAENEGETRRNHEQQQSVDRAVQYGKENLIHCLVRDWKFSSNRGAVHKRGPLPCREDGLSDQPGRFMEQDSCTGSMDSSPVKVLNGRNPYSVPSALILAFLETS